MRTKLQRKANAAIIEQVENYRQAAAGKKKAKEQARTYQQRLGEGMRLQDFAMPERAAAAFKMNMDRAAGALDVLHNLFPDLPAWRDTKWIH